MKKKKKKKNAIEESSLKQTWSNNYVIVNINY